MGKMLQTIRCIAVLTALVVRPDAAAAQVLAALPSPSVPAQEAGETRPILGWVKFCERNPAECVVDPREPATVQLTPLVWQTIVSVNSRVNKTIKPLTDQDHWGVADRWDYPDDGYGDCEDYQLLKRKLLSEAGLPRRAMRMTVVLDERGEGHAVLMIRTDRGDLILDNKIQSVRPWHETGYVYVKREGQDSTAWTSLGGATAPITTANR